MSAFVEYTVNPAQRLWFLWVLFFVTVFHQTGLFFSKKSKMPKWILHILIGVVLFAASVKFRNFCIPDIAKFYVFYVVACYLAPLVEKDEGRWLTMSVVISFAVFGVLGYWCDYPYPSHIPFTEIAISGGVSKLFKMLVAFWGIMTFILLFRLVANKQLKGMTIVGAKDTLGIHMVLLNIIPFKTFITPMLNEGHLWGYWLGVVLMTIALLVFSKVLIWLIRKNNYSSLLLLAENHIIKIK